MSLWKVSTIQKGCCEDRNTWVKGNHAISCIDGWRWGSFMIETSDDNFPDGITEDNEHGINMYDTDKCENIIRVDINGFDDKEYGVFDYLTEMSDEEKNLIEDGFSGEASYTYFQRNGWKLEETKTWFTGPLQIDRIE
jgi:hypothetical protein